MAYEQIQESLMREQEKRRMLQREMMRPDRYNPNAQVSGRSIPYSPIQGLTKLGKAFIEKNAMNKSDERTRGLKAEETAGRNNAFGQMQGTYFGQDKAPLRDNQGNEMAGPQTQGNEAYDANPVKAAMFAAQDPYLRDTGISRQIMPRQKTGGGSLSRPIPTSDGYYQQQADGSWKRMTDAKGEPLMYFGADAGLQGNIAGQKQQGKKDVDVVMNPEIKKQTDLAAREAEKIIDKPKIDSAISASDTKTDMLSGLIDKAKGQSSGWSTGIIGAVTGFAPQSPAYKLNATLETIKSNIGFDKLQEMRNNSPTGGALGQVSEFENKLLQAVWGNLNASAGEEQFRENLDLVQKQVDQSWKRIKTAYKQDYGVEYDETGGAPNPPTDKRQQLLDRY